MTWCGPLRGACRCMHVCVCVCPHVRVCVVYVCARARMRACMPGHTCHLSTNGCAMYVDKHERGLVPVARVRARGAQLLRSCPACVCACACTLLLRTGARPQQGSWNPGGSQVETCTMKATAHWRSRRSLLELLNASCFSGRCCLEEGAESQALGRLRLWVVGGTRA